MKRILSCTKYSDYCRHQCVFRVQLQKTVAPDWQTGIVSLTEDQYDASMCRLPGNYSRGLCLRTSDCRLSSDGRNRGLPARLSWRRVMRLPCIATHVGDWRDPCGWEQVLCGVITWATYHSGSLISPRREVRVDSP